jgi:hypothetical protein
MQTILELWRISEAPSIETIYFKQRDTTDK